MDEKFTVRLAGGTTVVCAEARAMADKETFKRPNCPTMPGSASRSTLRIRVPAAPATKAK